MIADLPKDARLRVLTDVAPATRPATPGSTGRMEIVLVGGERIIVGPDVDAAALARIIKALTRPGRAGLVYR
jgi:hypothetical protein